jgi:hypothetical protein
MIEIIDRNLYERSCDVRWWATDSAVVSCVGAPSPASAAHACKRLGVILDSYTVYLDLWIADIHGTVVANGQPGRYPRAIGSSVADQPWFKAALSSRDGSDYSVADISINGALNGAQVATYAAAIRDGGETNGAPIGVLGIFFDWQPQAESVLGGVRLRDDERASTRCLLLDQNHRVIAASDGVGVLSEVFPLDTSAGKAASYLDDRGRTIGYSLTPGYETYEGLGWYGVIVQLPRDAVPPGAVRH